jgi:hypothetical protein
LGFDKVIRSKERQSQKKPGARPGFQKSRLPSRRSVLVARAARAVPVAAAVGTAVHDSRRDVYAQQHHIRHLVTATITDDTAAQNISRTNTATMAARWSAAGAEHTGAVTAQSATEPGDQVAIWVDDSGALTDEPTPTTRAGVDAVTAALFMWAGVTGAAAILLAGTRAVGDRIRASRWQHAIDTLVGRDGHKPSQP